MDWLNIIFYKIDCCAKIRQKHYSCNIQLKNSSVKKRSFC